MGKKKYVLVQGDEAVPSSFNAHFVCKVLASKFILRREIDKSNSCRKEDNQSLHTHTYTHTTGPTCFLEIKYEVFDVF